MFINIPETGLLLTPGEVPLLPVIRSKALLSPWEGENSSKFVLFSEGCVVPLVMLSAPVITLTRGSSSGFKPKRRIRRSVTGPEVGRALDPTDCKETSWFWAKTKRVYLWF